VEPLFRSCVFRPLTIPLRPRRTGVALLVVCALSACGGGARAEREDAPRPAADSIAELEAIFRARRDSARMDFSEPDARFITGMITHHAQAVVMSRLVPTHGADPTVQTLAARIINSQHDEIATMQSWLRERGQPVPSPQLEGIEPTAHTVAHSMGVPGMLTPEQLRELDGARGLEFDRLFLTYMIGHHRGAVIMVDQLFATTGAAQGESVFQLASDIQADQKSEIERMERLLATLSGAGNR
jgi:uncharacterized protein (DUF305 family)